ncbi:amino acid adenylation domain-containing protein, partial [Nonomuraea sp. NPDC002799]
MRDGDGLPLSFAQERLWFLWRMAPDSPVYNVPMTYRLSGDLDVPALRQALTQVVTRHEVLRTRYVERDGKPVQLIDPPAPVDLPVVAVPDEDTLTATLHEQSAEPFDLTRPPLRATLFTLSPTEHVLCLVLHHIACDGWSDGVFWRELTTAYHGHDLPPLPIQYGDYAHWQRRWADDGEYTQQLTYWEEHLADLQILELPADRPRPAVQSFDGAHVPFTIPAHTAARIRDLAQATGSTTFMVLLAAFQLLLARLSGQRDIAIGTPVTGRTHEELAHLIGFFVNTVVMRTTITGDPTFTQLLAQVRTTTLDAYANQDVPFDHVVERLKPARDAGRTPLFQIMFTFDNFTAADEPAVALAALTAERGRSELITSPFDLTLGLRDSADGMSGEVEYNIDLYEPATIARIAGHFRELVRRIGDDPDLPLSQLESSIADRERERIGGWNATELRYEPDISVEEHFERHAAEHPDECALTWGDLELTYREVDERANRLAHLLQRLGCGPEQRVAVCVARGADMVIAPLAVLKAGAAFVPIDGEQPVARLADMLALSAPTVLLTDAGLDARCGRGSWQSVRLDEDAELIAAQPADRPSRTAPPGGLAYVIFTSGSTGKPKGVMITRRGLTNWREAWSAGQEHRALRRWLTTASPSFDVFVGDIVRSLSFGGTLVIGERTLALDPAALAETLREQRIDGFECIPPVLVNLAEQLTRTRTTLPRLRLIVTGSDSFNTADTALVLSAFDDRTRIINTWGATETTVDSSVYDVQAVVATGSGIVPVGGPIANSTIHVLDVSFRPVPIGAIGDLYIGGDGIARGYADRPALTGDRFVPDPFAATPGARLYRTGDRGRWLADGSVEFVGRDDDQVQIRGYRVEPGEIEAALRESPEVKDVFIHARAVGGGGHRIIAYVVPRDPESVSGDRLHTSAAERLPSYMRPAAFVLVPSLPRTVSGKVDRAALPDPGADETTRTEIETPRTPLELKVAEVWAEVLPHAGPIGIHDNFFDLGGHSLLATRLIFGLRSALGVDLPVHKVFEANTVAAMAATIETYAAAARPALEPVVRDGGGLPLSFAQERLWFLWRMAPDSPVYNVPMTYRLSGDLDVPALRQALTQVVTRHEVLRTRYVERDGKPVQLIDPPAPVDLPVVPIDEGELATVLHEHWAGPFDLTRPPLRATLFTLSPTEHVLCLVLHHIACDGWSDGVFWRELTTAYGGHDLPPLPVQYGDYAHWQRRWADDGGYAQQLTYWEEHLADLQILELPADRPRPPVQSFDGAYIPFTVPASTAAGIRDLAQATGSTTFMVLLAAFQLLLARLSGQRDIAIGTPVTGRTHEELAHLIGFFVNTVVMRTTITGDPTFTQLLAQVRTTTLDAYANQDVPFDHVVERLKPARDAGRTPLFQIMFTFAQDDAGGAVEADDLWAGEMDVEITAAQFDLILNLRDVPGASALTGNICFAVDLFDRVSVEAMGALFVRLLEAVAADPDQP